MSVLEVDDQNFKDELEKHKKVAVKYFADWCGTCRLFSPKYKRMSEDERFKDISFLEVNAEKNPDARKAGGVNNLPTISIFLDGKLLDSVVSGKEEAVTELLGKLADSN